MILNGEKISKKELSKLKTYIKNKKINARLDIIYIGDNPASAIFIKKKIEAAGYLNIKANLHKFNDTVKVSVIKATCNSLNNDPNCTGYFIQLPINKKLTKENILDYINPDKDVDCLTSASLGNFVKSPLDNISPATVEAVRFLLEKTGIRLTSKVVTVINDSNLIGKPLSAYLLAKKATVNVCNIYTKNLASFTSAADIVITATGKANLIKENMLKKGVILIDCGISKINGKTAGDVDFENIKKKAKFITPVPGGVGPLTVTFLFKNLIQLYHAQDTRQKNL